MCYIDIHEHTWTALGCKPNSTCKVDGFLPSRHLASPRVLNHGGVTIKERLDQIHLYPNLEVPGLTCSGWESNPGLPRGKRAIWKKPSRQLVNGMWAHDSCLFLINKKGLRHLSVSHLIRQAVNWNPAKNYKHQRWSTRLCKQQNEWDTTLGINIATTLNMTMQKITKTRNIARKVLQIIMAVITKQEFFS